MIKCGSEGYLELIVGPMFSGKTSRLLTLKRQYEICDISCCIVNHIDDDRYHRTKISTHDKIMDECLNVKELGSLYELLDKYEVFLINEGQFFDDLLDTVVDLVDKYKKKVYVCGLDGDYQRCKFGYILDLIPFCDRIVKLTALCKRCKDGTVALFSHRLSGGNEQKNIGADNYQPLCRKCFIKTT